MARSTGVGNVCLESWTLWILVAEDVMGSVAALAVGRHQQALLAQRKAVNRVHELGIDTRKTMLLPHAVVAVTLAAGSRNIEWVDRRARIGLGKDRVRIAVTARAGMVLAIVVHAAFQIALLGRMAHRTLHNRDLVRMRICLDVSMAVGAFKGAMNAGAELVAIDSETMACPVLHVLVSVAGEAFGLRVKSPGRAKKEEDGKQYRKYRVPSYTTRSRSRGCRVIWIGSLSVT